MRVAHGFISCASDTVFVTQQLSAKLLDPSAAFPPTDGKVVRGACSFVCKQLVEILLSLLTDTCPILVYL